jgi:superfamily I DNA and RNA helicase
MALDINVASTRLKSDQRARDLIAHLRHLAPDIGLDEGVLYYDFPLFRDSDDVLYRSKILLASPSHGIAMFATSELTDRTCDPEKVEAIDRDLSQLHSIIYGKLLKERVLRKSRQHLLFTPLTFIVLSDVTHQYLCEDADVESDVVFSLHALDERLAEAQLPEALSQSAWAELRSILEGAKGLLRPRERPVPAGKETGKAALLQKLESEIANFDVEQRRAALSIVDGPQRIRGLAGSGKTVVLAMKAAHLHLSDPDARILVTFHTKSLYGFIKRLITRFYRQFNDHDPDFEERLHVLHSWGGRTTPGVYFNACEDAGVPPLNFNEAQGQPLTPFDYVCRNLLDSGKVKQKYDYVLMDEAQDEPRSFFRLCFELTKGGPRDRNVVWAYDELQNIINVRTASPERAFGKGEDGEALVSLDRAGDTYGSPGAHDIVLHKCYRNPREILICAHALGFGIYSELMVQMLENKEHWEDVGYVVERGDCLPGQQTVITRPTVNSPLSISHNQDPEEIVSWYVAENLYTEVGWVVEEIRALVKDEGLRPDDIMVIALNDRNARAYFNEIAKGLEEHHIFTNNVLADVYNAPQFQVDSEVTLSTVYRAKGNEASVVFSLGIDALYGDRKLKRARNKIFTAFTRAKGWLRISGVGPGAQFYMDEVAQALARSPRLEFAYPDVRGVERLQRDLSDKASRFQKFREEMEDKIEQLELDDEQRRSLIETLKKSDK